MKKHHFLLGLLLLFFSCQQKKKEASGNTASPPYAEVDTLTKSGKPLKSILDSTVIRMSRVELTNHPVKDFALLMRVHHDGIRQFIEQGTPQIKDAQKDMAVLLIQLLQSANDMVQVMQDEEADYEISGFAEMMVPRNNKQIEKLRGWVSPGYM